MKNIVLLSFCLVSFLTVAQNSKYSKANQLFDDMRYAEASRLYESSIKEGEVTPELLQRAGDSYYFNSQMKEASFWYDQLFADFDDQTIDSRYAFRFIHALKGSGQLEKAKRSIEYFGEQGVFNPIEVAQLKKENRNVVDDILSRPGEFNITNAGINTHGSDFGPMFFEDKVVFASSRDSMNAQTREYHWNEQSFLNLFIADRGGRGRTSDSVNNTSIVRLNNATKFSRDINTKYHEASVAFMPGDSVMFFTRNNYSVESGKRLERDEEGVNHLKLYRATRSKSTSDTDSNFKWDNVTEVPFNSQDYSVGHPTVSKDGKTLYFVSDQPGGLGATDIYKVALNDDGTYGEIENLGPSINTAGREMFPYVTESKLYFSSDGYIGIGALDVFETQWDDKNEVYLEPRNLGAPLNSELDDFGFIVDEASKLGYFSSNRKGGKGDDDIYAFVRLAEVPLEVCTQTAKGVVVDILNGTPIPNATVQLFDSLGALLETVEADDQGTFAFSQILDCEKSYEALASKDGYKKSQNKVFVTTAELELELDLSLNLEAEIDLISEVNGVRKFKIENLYFDLDKHNIRPDAALELDKIVNVMTEYPSIVIKIESHTDSRGSDLYNEALSDRRAKSTRDYIISKGIDAQRIESAIGYGEKRLLNECKNRVKCSNEKHDINRRSEFIIIKM